MRDDAVLGRALPLDRGLGPPFSKTTFPLMILCLYLEPYKSYNASKLTVLKQVAMSTTAAVAPSIRS